MFVFLEEPVDASGREVRFAAAGGDARARQRERTIRGVGGEDLPVDVFASRLFLGQQHGE
jgi:hypothetical protein